jgi:hypothetical protein
MSYVEATNAEATGSPNEYWDPETVESTGEFLDNYGASINDAGGDGPCGIGFFIESGEGCEGDDVYMAIERCISAASAAGLFKDKWVDGIFLPE